MEVNSQEFRGKKWREEWSLFCHIDHIGFLDLAILETISLVYLIIWTNKFPFFLNKFDLGSL